MKTAPPLVGIDYGSKLAGTTVVAYSFDRHEVHFASSRKGQDADSFLLEQLTELRPEKVYIDAPLSLPGVYAGLKNCHDFFYRQADRELRAMSPMFLGGLTARAMHLSTMLQEKGIHCFEVYPAAFARTLGIKKMGYKKEKAVFFELIGILSEKYYLKLPANLPLSWHGFDALLAMLIGLRIEQQLVTKFGSSEEGIIYV